ncbi:MAG: glycosyltransferase family 2 protein [Candidatus Marsarchaeota archaeon]|nr:glycosyltransferase family 2 protein [Candidatus Marsarchaeota archaeon]
MFSKVLVSVGVPTCNRSPMLQRALNSLVAQDYPNLEIVISDNASTDATPEVCAGVQDHYEFIRYHRTPVMVPAFQNFREVLLLSRGDYFMWAADDDLWDRTFISTLVDRLESDSKLALVAAEAQYMLVDGTLLPMFPEGAHFYRPRSQSRLSRLLTVSRHNYGNLIYGLYRRQVLLTECGTVLDVCEFINEIPVFIQVAAQGRIEVCNKVLFYKTTSIPTYLQAAREYAFTPVLSQHQIPAVSKMPLYSMIRSTWSNRSGFAKLRAFAIPGVGVLKLCGYLLDVLWYHIRTLVDIRRAIWHIESGVATKVAVLIAFIMHLTRHFLKVAVVWQVQDAFSRKRKV